ncbi:MAG: hypothetical protein MI919_05540 [Holophagales bacterium]|nr:hypothetical protein [Holophagales bacterium]
MAEGGGGPPTPWIPLFLYLTAVLFYAMYEIGGDLDKRMPHRTAWLFVPVFLYLVVAGVATGRMPLRGEPVARQKSPRAFWALASLYLALALAMAVVGIGVFEN